MQAYTYMMLESNTSECPQSAGESPAGQRILDAAYALFREQGIDATTTRQIAEQAGVNEVTIFRRFGNKEGLVEAILARFFADEPMNGMLDHAPSGDRRRDLERLCREIMDLHVEREDFMRFVLVNLSHRPEYAGMLRMMQQAMLTRMGQLFEPWLAESNLDPFAVAIEFGSPILMRAISRILVGYVHLDDETFVRTHVEIFDRALGAPRRNASKESSA